MNAFYSFVDRVVDEQAEMSANELSINQIKDVDMKTSSQKVIQPQHLAIVKKNATKAIEQFIEAAKRKEIAEAAQDKLNGIDYISRQDSHQSGNYASLNINIEQDSDETILEKGLSIVSKDWKTIIPLGETEAELKAKIQAVESLDRLDVKGRLAHVNGAMSMYIAETRKARVLEWIQWHREELEAAEAEASDEEVETGHEEEDFAVLRGVDIEMIVKSDNENETTSEEEDLEVPTGVDIEMVVQSDDEDENTNFHQDSGVSYTGAVEDNDNLSDASSHSDNSSTEEVKLETNEKNTHTDLVDSAKTQELSSPALGQVASLETEVHEPMVENATSPSKVEAIDGYAREDQKAASVHEETTKTKSLSRRIQKRSQKKAAKKAREEAALAATREMNSDTPASKKAAEEKADAKQVSPISDTRRALEQISAPESIAIAYEFNGPETQVTIDIVLSDPEDISLSPPSPTLRSQ